jgi:hypothetical protein
MLRRLAWLGAIVLVLQTSVAAGSATANCEVAIMDFEPLKIIVDGTFDIGTAYTEDGMTVTAVQGTLIYVGTLSTSFAGSTMLFHHIGGGLLDLTTADGRAFDFISIAIAELPSFDGSNGRPINFGPFEITFVGTKANGSTVSQTVTAEPFPVVTTFKVHGFSNVVSVQWRQGGGGAPGRSTHQFDNVIIRQ